MALHTPLRCNEDDDDDDVAFMRLKTKKNQTFSSKSDRSRLWEVLA